MIWNLNISSQLFIVSSVEVAGYIYDAPEEAIKLEHAAILVTKANGETCERCWNISEEVGTIEKHPTLCERCSTVVDNEYPELG